MNRAWNLSWVRWALGTACLQIGATVAVSDEKPKVETGEKQAATQQGWLKLTSPDEHHKQLDGKETKSIEIIQPRA